MSKYDSDNFSDFFNDTSDNVKDSRRRRPDNSGRANNPNRHVDIDFSQYNDDYYDDDYYDDPDEDYSDGDYYDEDYSGEDYREEMSPSGNRRNSSAGRTKKSDDAEARKMRKKLRESKSLGMKITTIQLIISVVFFIFLIFNKETLIFEFTIPNMCIAAVVLLVLYLIPTYMQHRGLRTKLFGKIISILLSLILVITMLLYGTIVNDLLKLGGNEKVTSREPFLVYLSGNDSEGDISTTSNGRSDTNIIAVVNPKTSTILLLTTPRDSYLKMIGKDVPDDAYDKLTHAGLYGSGVLNENGSYNHGYDVSMQTLSNLYDIDLKHYVRINFTGFINLVDAMGGIDIDIPESFRRYEFDRWFEFQQGPMHLDGYYALTFVRERHSFANGDFQRGQNQTLFIKALINQAISTNTIANYSKIMDAIGSSFETDLNVASLVAVQTALTAQGKGSWNIVNFSVEGGTGSEYCYKLGDYASVVYLDDDSVDVAKQLINLVLDGKKITDTTAEEIANGTYGTEN